MGAQEKTPLEGKIERYLADNRRLPENRDVLQRFNAERQARLLRLFATGRHGKLLNPARHACYGLNRRIE